LDEEDGGCCAHMVAASRTVRAQAANRTIDQCYRMADPYAGRAWWNGLQEGLGKGVTLVVPKKNKQCGFSR
jgi:hypothetical protein